jgi:16S rRNA (adenine1518-N6/adenine1519-N6)-dimethyltransferase
VAAPGTKEYGILSVFSALYAEAVILFDVSRNCFYPKPNVTSSVLRLSLRKELPRGTDEKLFRTLVKTTFGKRRKTLRKSLEYLPFASDSGALAHGFAETLRGSPLDLERRPETLSVDEFLLLARHIAATLPWPKNR